VDAMPGCHQRLHDSPPAPAAVPRAMDQNEISHSDHPVFFQFEDAIIRAIQQFAQHFVGVLAQ
jgi:hypothetical protein